jgi:translation initiation factor 1
VKVDSKGRKGKTVTIIAGLPKHELFLKEMTRQLKEKCGAGGSYLLDGKDGEVVIQGNHLERIRAFLDAENILVK